MLAYSLVALVLSYIGWTLICLEANVRKARRLGVPVQRLPVDVHNLLWIIIQPHIWKVLDSLPIPWASYPTCIRYARRGWYVPAKAEAHVRMGPVWALVTPVMIDVHVADPDAILDMVTRRGDFQRPHANFKLLELYGPCISSASWEEWPRHRKPVATPFNESLMKPADTRMLSLNVLAAIGFGSHYDFRGSDEPAAVGDEVGDYRDSLMTVLDNIILLMLVPFHVLTKLPGRYARIGNAGIAFKRHLVKLLDDETAALNEGRPSSGAIMPSFARAAERYHREHPSGDGKTAAKARGLSAEEIFGNLFVINFAGHDSTANTSAFAVLLLAAHPDIQAWVAEEVGHATKGYAAGAIEDWDYKTLYPRLKRCRAVLYKTLRLYPPVPALPSVTRHRPQSLRVGDRTLTVPIGSNFTVNLRAMQMHPDYWPDADEWRPSRWITNPEGARSMSEEELITPGKTVFIPWGEGPQACPGKKVAEVEEVAVLACLLKSHRLATKKKYDGETDEAVYKRFEKCVNDIDLEMLVKLRDGDQIALNCTEAS
ncbi:cytochrome P450 [Apiospora saccharicola]|uniref:Cytochrome P450 n=1 Tax=Apiospora saccharicola TaxID=335842 RepID=A0ABR1W8V9_9PEZI